VTGTDGVVRVWNLGTGQAAAFSLEGAGAWGADFVDGDTALVATTHFHVVRFLLSSARFAPQAADGLRGFAASHVLAYQPPIRPAPDERILFGSPAP
jgi:hypothetical protein